MKNNIVLVGMRGSGKSHFGSLLSRFLHMPKIDIDECVEIMTGKTIPRIIETEGWEAFREYEHQAIIRACQLKNVIISTGGGSITFERNREHLSKNGYIVFLFASLQQLLKRLETDATIRPNLTQETCLQDEIIKVWNERKNIYFSAADLLFWSKDNLLPTPRQSIILNAKILAERLKKI